MLALTLGATLSSPGQASPTPQGARVVPSATAAAGTNGERAERGTAEGGGGGNTVSAVRPGITPTLLAPPAGFDIQASSQAVLAHLNAVVRYFRTHMTPIQKVGEPSDALYRDQALGQLQQVAGYAFQSARAEAALLTAYAKAAKGQSAAAPPTEGEAQKLQTVRATVAQRLVDLKQQYAALGTQIDKAKPRDREALEQEREQVDGAIDLNTAMSEALAKIVGLSDSQGRTGLSADVERLARSAPEMASAAAAKPMASTTLESFSAARSAGVSSQAALLFQLLATEHSIDQWIADADALHEQALALRTPLTEVVRSLVQSSQAISDQVQAAPVVQPAPTGKTAKAQAGAKAQAAAAKTPAVDPVIEARRKADAATATFQVVSAAVVPLSQEIITLEQSRANLVAWRTAVAAEHTEVLKALLWHVFFIALALGVLSLVGNIWRRATTRYVHDVRRRRQLLVLRRVVIGFFSGLVVIFGFVTQFNSLATFAGFITAGLAVGLQTILLSVAAYFFIVGRYGVRVGDRVSVASVTGDVIDVGLVRFYVMELAGTDTELHPTGRVAVLSNAILFQAGTPLYKQMPGTEYSWHELTVKLTAGADVREISGRLLGAVNTVYDTYKAGIEAQYRALQAWMDTPIKAPGIESHLQFVEGGLQLWVRYPVELRRASATDDALTESILALMAKDEQIRQAVASQPVIRSVAKA